MLDHQTSDNLTNSQEGNDNDNPPRGSEQIRVIVAEDSKLSSFGSPNCDWSDDEQPVFPPKNQGNGSNIY